MDLTAFFSTTKLKFYLLAWRESTQRSVQQKKIINHQSPKGQKKNQTDLEENEQSMFFLPLHVKLSITQQTVDSYQKKRTVVCLLIILSKLSGHLSSPYRATQGPFCLRSSAMSPESRPASCSAAQRSDGKYERQLPDETDRCQFMQQLICMSSYKEEP